MTKMPKLDDIQAFNRHYAILKNCKKVKLGQQIPRAMRNEEKRVKRVFFDQNGDFFKFMLKMAKIEGRDLDAVNLEVERVKYAKWSLQTILEDRIVLCSDMITGNQFSFSVKHNRVVPMGFRQHWVPLFKKKHSDLDLIAQSVKVEFKNDLELPQGYLGDNVVNWTGHEHFVFGNF